MVMRREVGMDVQKAAAVGLVQPAAVETRIGNQPVDAGERRQPGNKSRRVQLVDHLTDKRRKQRPLRQTELVLVVVLPVNPLRACGARKFAGDVRGHVGIEEVHEVQVREGLLARTPRGRVATAGAWRHLGLPAPAGTFGGGHAATVYAAAWRCSARSS